MSDLLKSNPAQLKELLTKLESKFEDYKSQKLSLDMSRGKPCTEQLDLSNGLLNCLGDNQYKTADGTDCRNYGGVDGIAEAKELFAQMLEVSPKEIIIGGNSSLNMMYDTIARALLFGVYGSDVPWSKSSKIKFLCPSPGYDRHFSICQLFNIEMIIVPMNSDGPDMDLVEKLVSSDDSIKGIWCTPKYSNPDGITYSDTVVDRFAAMKTKAKDFRIFWDNAYAFHHLTNDPDSLKDILSACKETGNPDRVFIFSSTSKVTFPGAGVAMMGASENNINLIKKQIFVQSIGPDKINQLRHIKFLPTTKSIEEQMVKQAQIIKPKFDAVLDILDEQLSGKNIAWWNKPNGGYFISLNTMEGCAKAVVAMAKDAGVTLTPAGATFPYGNDPLDRNIRIAPTFPSLADLKKAIEILCTCIQIISIKNKGL